MAHRATLKLENKEYSIIECEYEFVQAVKATGQPAGRPVGGLIHITMVAPDDDDLQLHNWMQSATEHKDGRIIFEVTGDEKPFMKTLSFKYAYCVRLHEHFDTRDNSLMLTKITISAAEISFGEKENVTFKNDTK